MKIMIQDRTMIVEQPDCVWVDAVSSSDTFIVASDSKRAPVLGTYQTNDRAKTVLMKLFEQQRSGRCNFYMPKE